MKVIVLLFIPMLVQMCTGNPTEMAQKYQVQKISEQPEINAVWDKMPWKEIEPLQLKNYMGDKPDHFPFTQAKVAYDHTAIYVIFRVEDRYVRAVADKNQGPVYMDSCVEFFFTPGQDIRKGYFNLEMNCGGTMLFHHQIEPRTDQTWLSEDHIRQVEVAHTLPRIVEPEIETDTTWIVEYRIPFSILGEYHSFPTPEAGTVWKANFYKCADKTSHPHWLTWAPVDFPTPNFHLPEFFGTLKFQE
jgi:hypothetical protein